VQYKNQQALGEASDYLVVKPASEAVIGDRRRLTPEVPEHRISDG
jgi:hypothetical protein